MQRSRIAIVSVLSVTVIYLAVAGGFLALKEKEHRLRLSVEKKLVKSFDRNDQLEKQLGTALKGKTETEARLRQTEKQLSELNGSLSMLEKELRRTQRETGKIRGDYRRILRQKHILLSQLRMRDREIKHILSELVDVKGDGQIVNLGSVMVSGRGVSDGVVVERGHGSSVVKAGIEGEIVAINKEFEFVVVSLGRRHGVQEGTRLLIFRGQRPVGRATVEMAHEGISAATIAGLAGLKIQIGDTARIGRAQPSLTSENIVPSA